MKAPALRKRVQTVPGLRRLRTYRAKVVKADPTEIVVLLARSLTVGQRITYATVADLERAHLDRTPIAEACRSAVVWRVDADCLHLTRT